MTTPPGRPLDPSDLSTWSAGQTSGRFADEGKAHGNDLQRATDALSPVHRMADFVPRVAGVAFDDPLRSPYAPKTSLRRAPEADHPPTPPANFQDETSNPDLDRRETSLGWSQRQESPTLLADDETKPGPALARRAAAVRRPYTKRVGLQSLPIPEFRRIGFPLPRSCRSHLSWLLPTLIAIGIAVPILFYFSEKFWRPVLEPPRYWALRERFDIPRSVGQENASPINFPGDRHAAVAPPPSFGRARAVPAEARSSNRTVLQPVDVESPRLVKPIHRELDPEEIALLVKQGEQFVASGDLAGARTVLQRAAEAGEAIAAVALGATYDPAVLKKLGVIGMKSDLEKARSWYQKAESLGSVEATQRLKILAGQ